MGRECWLGSKDHPRQVSLSRSLGWDIGCQYCFFPPRPPSHGAQSPRRDAWTQETLRTRARGLGSRLEGEKGAGISDPTPDRHPSPPLTPPRGLS